MVSGEEGRWSRWWVESREEEVFTLMGEVVRWSGQGDWAGNQPQVWGGRWACVKREARYVRPCRLHSDREKSFLTKAVARWAPGLGDGAP